MTAASARSSTPARARKSAPRRLVLRTAKAKADQGLEIAVADKPYRVLVDHQAALKGLIEKMGRSMIEAEAQKTSRRFYIDIAPDQTFTVVPDRAPQARAKARPRARAETGDALDQALAAARERGRGRVADILADPDMLTAETFADRIGVSHTTVHDWRRRHEVLGLQGVKRGYRFPAWQLTDSGEVAPGLAQVFAALGDHPWSVYRFLLARHGELDGRTAIEALKAGDLAAVDVAARNVAEGVAG